MGKRSDFVRKPRDYWPTPESAILPLLPHLKTKTMFCEPCAGNGAMLDVLEAHGHRCLMAWDSEPMRDDIEERDALTGQAIGIDCYITNPPWSRGILHPLIVHLSGQYPTWLLFDADWVHTQQAKPYFHLLQKVVSVGRVKWVADTKHSGKDNCAWHLFDARNKAPAQLFGR